MKKLSLILILLFFYRCSGTDKEIVKIGEIKKVSQLKSVKKIEPLLNRNRLPLIDNFESDDNHWGLIIAGESRAFFNIVSDKPNNKAAYLNYEIKFSDEEYSPNRVSLVYNHKMNFKSYNGISFTAKGDSKFIYKVKVFEVENYYMGNKKEVWYKTFKVTPEFKLYKINFNEMKVEEFFEQDYVSDNIQTFTNISGIGFTIQNGFSADMDKGNLYIDNILLF